VAVAYRAGAPVSIIVERVRPPRALAKTKLAKLKLAPVEGKAEIEKGDYASVVGALRNEHADPDKLNNLGCAYAWLALETSQPSYWTRAINALEDSKARPAPRGGDKAEAAYVKREQVARADANLEIIRELISGPVQ
jgi:hypothetical protein